MFEDYVREVANRFPVSRPIFVALGDSRNLYFDIKCRAQIDLSKIQDPIEKKIAECCSETLLKNGTGFEFIRRCNTESVYAHITNVVKSVYEKNCGLKQPRQSRMYSWLNSLCGRYNHESYEGFMALYRYIAQHANRIGDRYDGTLAKVHADNVIAVLEKMRNKYEDNPSNN